MIGINIQNKVATLKRYWPVLLSALFFFCYLFLFWQSVQPYWFHPGWTTDDGLQQLYPFYEILHPGIFKGDLITEVMRGYLPPIHYAITAAFTWLTDSPIMAGHWVHFVQLTLSLVFIFLLVKHLTGVIPALFAMTWLLHTRYVMQRLTAGLPRGWALVTLLAFLYFFVSKRHRAVLVTLCIGCILHPPSTLVAATGYGLSLLIDSCRARKISKELQELMMISPVCVGLVLWVVARPDYIGSMVSYTEALTMPEFSRPRGRFPFVPLNSILHEVHTFGFQAFLGRLYNPGKFIRQWAEIVICLLPLIFIAVGYLRKRTIIPRELWFYLVGVITVYLASRVLAFKLYVPDRHVQFPMAIFFIVVFTVAVWRIFERPQLAANDRSSLKNWPAIVALMMLGGLLYVMGGDGFKGTSNFNYSSTKKGEAFNWIKRYTPMTALIAGEPTHIDPVPLFAMRRAFATTETAHPFYPVYNLEIRRRLDISLRAHYAETIKEFHDLLIPEKVDYFIFKRNAFYPANLATAKYFPPLDDLMIEVNKRDPQAFAFREMVQLYHEKRFPPIVYRDNDSIVVDIKKLAIYMSSPGATNNSAGEK